MLKLNDEETFLIETVRRFVDREVKPTVSRFPRSTADRRCRCLVMRR
jgi:hypothetical protein